MFSVKSTIQIEMTFKRKSEFQCQPRSVDCFGDLFTLLTSLHSLTLVLDETARAFQVLVYHVGLNFFPFS